MNIEKILEFVLAILSMPEVSGLIVTVVVSLLVKNKVISEKDIATARKMIIDAEHLLDDAPKTKALVGSVTDVTTLKKDAVLDIAREVKAELNVPNTNKKKIQRAIRKGLKKLIRGWL